MSTTKLSMVDVVRELESRVQSMEQELQRLRQLASDVRTAVMIEEEDRKFADDIINGVKDDSTEQVSNLRVGSVLEEKKGLVQDAQEASVSQAVPTIVVGKRRGEEDTEKMSPLEAAWREISSCDEGSSQPIFPTVAEELRRVEQLVANRDIEQLTSLMDHISEMFGIYYRTQTRMSSTTRREIMERVRDIVFVLIEEYMILMEQGKSNEAGAIHKAMEMTGIVRLEKMVEKKDLPLTVIARMEQLDRSINGENKATQLLDALSVSEEVEDSVTRPKVTAEELRKRFQAAFVTGNTGAARKALQLLQELEGPMPDLDDALRQLETARVSEKKRRKQRRND